MYEGVEPMGWAMFGMIALVLLAEIVDMIASAWRRRYGERLPAASFGSFNLEPRESTLARRHAHTTRTSGGGWGGLNKVD